MKRADHLVAGARVKRAEHGLRFGFPQWAMVTLVSAMVIAGCAAAPTSSYESSAPMSGGVAPAAVYDESVAQSASGENSVSAARKIIARASIDLVVADAQVTANSIETLVSDLGGYVSATNLYRSNDILRGSITLRVPSENLEATLDALTGMAVQVSSHTLNREDVTDQYTDVDAQIRNLEATEQELLAMLEEVRERPNSTTEDIMSVYRTLTEVRGQIETLQGRKNMWDNLISLSTIEVGLYPDAASLPVTDDSWRPAAVAREAQRTLVAAIQVLGNLIIWVGIVVIPLILVALIPLSIGIWFLRWLFRRFSKPKAKALATVPPANPPSVPPMVPPSKPSA